MILVWCITEEWHVVGVVWKAAISDSPTDPNMLC